MSRSSTRRSLWWINPAVVLGGMTFPLVVLAHVTPPERFLREWRTPDYLDASTFWLFSAATGALAVGVLLAFLLGGADRPQRLRPGTGPGPETAITSTWASVLEPAATLLYRLTLIGYLAWVGSAVLGGVRPADVLELLQSGDTATSSLRERVATIPGVTTLTQFGIAVVILAALGIGGRRTARRRIAVLLVLSVTRAWLLNERLALIEVLVPLTVVRSQQLYRSAGGWRRRSISLAPVVLLPALIAGFALFEHSRSWTWYSKNTDTTYEQFVVTRLSGYYVTAFNNGALGLRLDRWDGRLPHDTIAALWEFPGFDQVLSYEQVTGRPFDEYRQDQFARFGNDEFNSPSGLAAPLIDLGVFGGLGFLLAAGLLLGGLHRSFAAGRLPGLLLYPVFFTGVLELPRYLYWSTGRAAPALGALVVLSWLAARRASTRGVARPRPTALAEG